MKLDSILFPTDFSECADHALDQAIRLAAAHDASLHVFHGLVLHEEDPGRVNASLSRYLEHAEAEAGKLLFGHRERCRAEGIPVTCSVRRALTAHDAIAAEIDERRPDLVVMGTHGRHGLRRLALGSVARKTVAHARGDVLTVRKDAELAPAVIDRVVAAVDFSEHSRRALDRAHEVVSQSGDVTAVHVVSVPIHPSFYAAGVSNVFDVDRELRGRVEEELRRWSGGEAGVLRVHEGDPVARILEAARLARAQLIVVGSRGLGVLDRVLLGSVAERVVDGAPVPVWVVT